MSFTKQTSSGDIGGGGSSHSTNSPPSPNASKKASRPSPPGQQQPTTMTAGQRPESIPLPARQGIMEAMQHLDKVGLTPTLASVAMLQRNAGNGGDELSSTTSTSSDEDDDQMGTPPSDHHNNNIHRHQHHHHAHHENHDAQDDDHLHYHSESGNTNNNAQAGGSAVKSNSPEMSDSASNNNSNNQQQQDEANTSNGNINNQQGPSFTTGSAGGGGPNDSTTEFPSDQQQQQQQPSHHQGRTHFKKRASAVMANLRSSKPLWDNSGAAKPLSRGNVINPLQVMHESLHKLLWNVPHVNVLTPEELRSLKVLIREYGVMDVVMDRGTQIQHVYALISGSVEVFDDRNSRHMEKRVGSINAPNLFGMDGIVFDQPCQFAMRAGDKAVMVLIPKADFLRCIASNKQFAHSLTRPIVENMGLFNVFQDFCRAVFTTTSDVAAASDGTMLNLTAILGAYRKLDNVIHPLVNDPDIDVGGWLYASRRLPENVAESLVINLARALPAFLARDLRQHVEEGSTTGEKKKKTEEDEEGMTSVKYIQTHDRRRCAWQIGDKGHTFVLLRESYTDVLDFITCMCIHIVESQKLRQRLRSMVGKRAIDVMHAAVCRLRKLDRAHPEFASDSTIITDSALAQLPLNEVEVQGLKRIWPSNCLSTIYEILLHREEYMITLDVGNLGRFDVDPYVRWALSLRRHLLNSIGLSEVDEVPSDVTIDVLSSNTHSTKNCMCSIIRKKAEQIEEWASQKMAAISALDWFNRNDFLFFAFAKMLSEDPELRKEYRNQLLEDGFTIIEDSAMTGLQVDIVDLTTIDVDNVDTVLQPAAKKFKKAYRESPKPSRCFLLNMDFAFGAQADYITHALILVFGRAIRSFNVMGKAGALVGNRGDVQIPTSIVFSKSALGEDSTDENRTCGNEDLLPSRVRELSGPAREVHVGPVLTIPGTLLQNEKLLRFYRTVIGCVGLEMEGTYFARQLEEAIETGLLSPFCRRRFAYYTSDLPLRTQSASLSKPLAPNEGIPPMYSITRSFLERIFIDCADRQIKFEEHDLQANFTNNFAVNNSFVGKKNRGGQNQQQQQPQSTQQQPQQATTAVPLTSPLPPSSLDQTARRRDSNDDEHAVPARRNDTKRGSQQSTTDSADEAASPGPVTSYPTISIERGGSSEQNSPKNSQQQQQHQDPRSSSASKKQQEEDVPILKQSPRGGGGGKNKNKNKQQNQGVSPAKGESF